MDRDELVNRIEELASEESLAKEHTYDDFQRFLLDSVDGDIPLYINRKNGPFLYSFFLPEQIELNVDHIDDINQWNFDAISVSFAGSISCATDFPDGKKRERLFVTGPLSSCGSILLQKARPLFFERTRDLDDPDAYFLELAQIVSHALCLFPSLEEPSKWVHPKLSGEVDDVAWGVLNPYPLLTIRREHLDLFLHAAGGRLLRVFDFTRLLKDKFECWSQLGLAENRMGLSGKHPFYARHHIERNEKTEVTASFFRGFQVVTPLATDVEVKAFYESYW